MYYVENNWTAERVGNVIAVAYVALHSLITVAIMYA